MRLACRCVLLVAFAFLLCSEITTARAAEATLVSYFNRHAIDTDVSDYGDRVLHSIDLAAQNVGKAMESMTLVEFAKVYESEKLSDDGRFLLAVTWIRVHCDAGRELVSRLTLRRARKSEWPNGGQQPLMDDGLYSSGPAGYYIEAFRMERMDVFKIIFQSKGRTAHTIVVGILNGNASGKPQRLRYRWWILDTAVDSRFNVALGRRIERGWYVTKEVKEGEFFRREQKDGPNVKASDRSDGAEREKR